MSAWVKFVLSFLIIQGQLNVYIFKLKSLKSQAKSHIGPICFEFTNYPRTNNRKWLSQSLMTLSDKLRFSNVFWTLITFVLSAERYFWLENISGWFSSRIQWSRVGGCSCTGLMRKNGATLHPNFQIRQNCTKFMHF